MANYPNSLPAISDAGANLSTNPHSGLHDDLRDEQLAIATELGTNPKGSYTSVKTRLDGAWLQPSHFLRSTNQAITTSTATAITFESEVSDTEGWGTVSTATFTCPTNGLYLISASLLWSETVSSATASTIELEGEPLEAFTFAGGFHFIAAETCFVFAGDTVQVMAEHTEGSTKNVDVARVYFKRLA